MLIHSVTPAQMLIEQPEMPQLVTKPVKGGYLEGYETPQGFQMTRLCSTDPSLYLRGDYSPGSVLGVGCKEE